MLDPERPVLVEGGDALGLGHKRGGALFRGRVHELDDGGLGGAVIPGRQVVALRIDMGSKGENGSRHTDSDPPAPLKSPHAALLLENEVGTST